jgi:hypothetical protein
VRTRDELDIVPDVILQVRNGLADGFADATQSCKHLWLPLLANNARNGAPGV